MVKTIVYVIIWLILVYFTKQYGFLYFIKYIVYAVAEIKKSFIKKL